MAWIRQGTDNESGLPLWFNSDTGEMKYGQYGSQLPPDAYDANGTMISTGWNPNMAFPTDQGGYSVKQLSSSYLANGGDPNDTAALERYMRAAYPQYSGSLDPNAIVPPSAMPESAPEGLAHLGLLAPALFGIMSAAGATSLADLPTFSGNFDPTIPGVQVSQGAMPTQVAGWYGEAPNLDPNGIWSGNYSAPAETTISEMAGGAATPGQVSPTSWYPGSLNTGTGGLSMPNVNLSEIMKYAGPLSNVLGGVLGAGAAKSAANTQAQSAREAIAAQMAMYGQTRADLEPYRTAGASALGQLQDYTNGPNSMLLKPFGMEDFQKSPAYEFNLSEGMRALNHGAASRGNYYAPATLKSLSDFAQGRASNEFQNAFSNYQTNMGNVWNRLSSLAGMGQNASAQMGSLGANVASQTGANLTGIGNAQAAGQVGSANAISGGMSNAYNAYLMDQILSKNQSSLYGK